MAATDEKTAVAVTGQESSTDSKQNQQDEKSARCTYNPDQEAAATAQQNVTKQTAESDQEAFHGGFSSSSTALDSDQDGASPSHEDAPDGGRTAWLVVLGAWCSSFCAYGWINSKFARPRRHGTKNTVQKDNGIKRLTSSGVGTFQEYYESGPLSNYSPSTISWIPSLQIFFMSFLGPVVGRLFDRYGPRIIILVGSFLHVFGLMMASLSTEYYQFLLSQGVCSAIGSAAVFMCALACTSGWFHKRRGLAFGTLATGSSLGGVVFPILVSNLINHVGYGWAMRTCAFIILALLVVANLTLKSRFKPAPLKVSRDQLGKPFREIGFLLLLVGLFFIPFGLYVPIDYMPVVSIRSGISTKLSRNLIAFYNAASLMGRLSSGYLSDRWGKFNVFVGACYTSGILILALWIPAVSAAASITFSVLFGLFSGAYIALMGALVAQISPLSEIGYRNGVSMLFSAVGGLVTNPIAGAILERPNGMAGLKAFAGSLMIAGTTGVLLARLSQTGMKAKVAY